MTTAEAPRTLDWTKPQKVVYAVPLWLRDEQIRVNTALVPGRIEMGELQTDPIAVVCYGPSLNETWEKIRDFKYVMTCSGAHHFMIERGIVPTWQVDVDPRLHKLQLIGEPHKDVEYLLASTCHPKYVRKLYEDGYRVKLWHIFDSAEEALRVLPPGEWALTGGCSVGLRAMAMARFLGFRQIDVFGMDGSSGKSGKHAAAHPNQSKDEFSVDFKGRTFYTTPGFLEAARSTGHELNQLPDVNVRFHGEGLVQAMMHDYVRDQNEATGFLCFQNPELISSEYRALNKALHEDNLAYGISAQKYAGTIKKLIKGIKTLDGMPVSVLDYGCGKGFLQKELPFPIFEYDPAIPGKEAAPRAADLVCCLDVLEHIEPDRLMMVLGDLRRCVRQLGYFVIHTGPSQKTLADGRNTHLLQHGEDWWRKKLGDFFKIALMKMAGKELHVLVGPLKDKAKKPTGKVMVPSAPSVALNLDGVDWRMSPYPIGCVSPVLAADTYQQLARTFPPLALFKAFGGGKKWSLSQVNNHDQYVAFLASSPLWKQFYDSVKAPAFIEQIRHVLEAQGLDALKYHKKLSARFEFSLLPADGGNIRPHTDISSKLVTLVVSMLPTAGDWDRAWGGGTQVLVPRPGLPPLDDYKADWDAFDVVHTYHYQPNQCVAFVKTADSWHAVAPMAGAGSSALRRTLTINVEKAV